MASSNNEALISQWTTWNNCLKFRDVCEALSIDLEHFYAIFTSAENVQLLLQKKETDAMKEFCARNGIKMEVLRAICNQHYAHVFAVSPEISTRELRARAQRLEAYIQEETEK